ncbi:STYKc [Musa troglodytarum]|uniref:non-specific serine/threonine protein kinase n=1 Tax=Musa troglodytarum TaxID=320322 RepID=A0A9E7HFJ9_9LILI|nr:STYKc [Musa troglodytarum]
MVVDYHEFWTSSLYQMSSSIAAIVGAAAGGLALLVIIIGFLWFYILCCRTPANKSSETGSSDPSNPVEWGRRDRISCAGCGLASEHQGARQFTLEELEEATKNFSESNIVGTGSFGLVYKGLLLDGTIVAIKRRVSVPRQAFTEQVRILSEIRHRNLVTLIGYCQEGGLQMLIFEYLPNGSISGHLYDSEQHSLTRLEFKQRLAVAIGAAKGLAHLHGLSPPVVHKDFKTSNVLVDENFIAKVADAGVFKLLQGTGEVEAHMGSNDLIDCRLGGGFTSEGMKELIALTLQCLNPSGHSRPKMRAVVVELDRILEMEMALTMVMGDGTAIVTLGSQLFTSA